MKIKKIASNLKHILLTFTDKIKNRKKINLIHIGKTGGSALKNVFRKQLRTSEYVFVLHSHSVTLKDIPVGEKVIFCLRDPQSRFISGFYSRLRQGKPLYNFPWSNEEKIAFNNFLTPNALAESLSSENSETKLQAENAMKSIQHVQTYYTNWLISQEYILERKSDILMIFNQDNLTNEFNEFKFKVGLNPQIYLPVDAKLAHKNSEDVDKKLSDLAVQNIKNWYKSDYELIDFVIKNNLMK